MAGNFKCSIVTPEAEVFEGEATYASIPAHDGQMGIAPMRAPALVKLGDGALRIDEAGGDTRWYFLEGGFAQVVNDKVTLLTNRATPASEIDSADARKALEDAMAQTANDDEAIDARLAAADRARGQIELAKSHGA